MEPTHWRSQVRPSSTAPRRRSSVHPRDQSRLVTNSSLFGSGSDRNVRVARINFLRSLPPRDSDPILPGNRTSDPTLAAFVEVTVEPIRLRTILPASIFGGSNVLTVGAQAVAGFDQVVCDFTPIFICNPFETRGMTYRRGNRGPGQCQQRSDGPKQTHPAYWNSGKDRRTHPRRFRICYADNRLFAGASLRPHYGWWYRPGHSRITTAYLPALSGVDLQLGNDQIAMDGLNTRFDIYANGFESVKRIT